MIPKSFIGLHFLNFRAERFQPQTRRSLPSRSPLTGGQSGGEEDNKCGGDTRKRTSKVKTSWKECVRREEDCGKVKDMIYYWHKRLMMWDVNGKKNSPNHRIRALQWNYVLAKTGQGVRQPLFSTSQDWLVVSGLKRNSVRKNHNVKPDRSHVNVSYSCCPP